jgi:hypothetical protein
VRTLAIGVAGEQQWAGSIRQVRSSREIAKAFKSHWDYSMDDKEALKRLSEIRDLLREQTFYAKDVMQIQRTWLVRLTLVFVVLVAAIVLYLWDVRRRDIELQQLSAQDIRMHIEVMERGKVRQRNIGERPTNP